MHLVPIAEIEALIDGGGFVQALHAAPLLKFLLQRRRAGGVSRRCRCPKRSSACCDRRSRSSGPTVTRRSTAARDLRLACRCALCIEETSGRPLLEPSTVPDNVRAKGDRPDRPVRDRDRLERRPLEPASTTSAICARTVPAPAARRSGRGPTPGRRSGQVERRAVKAGAQLVERAQDVRAADQSALQVRACPESRSA